MGIKFRVPETHYLGIDDIAMNAISVGITAYGWTKKEEETGAIQELWNIYGGGIGFGFLGWDAAGNFLIDCTGAPVGGAQFSVNPPLGEWFFWAVTMLTGTDTFIGRWYYNDGTLGAQAETDCAATDALINMALMGFPGNEQGVKGVLGRFAAVNDILTAIELEAEMRVTSPEVPAELCMDGNSLEDVCNGYTLNFSTGTGEIVVDEQDNPDLEPLFTFDESLLPNAISNVTNLVGTVSDIDEDPYTATAPAAYLTRSV